MQELPKPYTYRFWGKADRKNPSRIHLLEHHLADVGACFEMLLRQPNIRHRLAYTAGWDDVDDTTAARLSIFATLHDIGKVNVGFQTQIWCDADLPPGTRKPRPAGHTLDLTPVLQGEDRKTASWFFSALRWNDFLAWDDQKGETACGMLIATLSHHGRPLQLEGSRQPFPQLWRPLGELNPQKYTQRIGQLIREWFPAAFTPGGRPLPSPSAFQHHFLGLCNLADWIGSNEEWFGYVDEPQDDYIKVSRLRAGAAITAVGLDISTQRKSVASTSMPSITTLFPHISQPRAIQQAAHDVPLDEPLVIIESETGSGKTEAALWRFAEMYFTGLVDGLYFALPTRAAAKQIFDRVRVFIVRMFPADAAPVPVLAVPGYLRAGEAEGQHLHNYEVWWDDHAHDRRRWAAESPKRFLTAQIAVGTVDQAMLGALRVKNAHLRASSLARNLLVVDEVHASDAYMSKVLAAVLEAHAKAGGYALLMSATLGSVARRRWFKEPVSALAEAVHEPYPTVSTRDGIVETGENGQDKAVSVMAKSIMRDANAIAYRVVNAASAGAKVLVVRNTVDYAVSTYQAVMKLAGNEMPILLHHGRFAAVDRELLDGKAEEWLGRERLAGGCIVVGTQTLEQSLDIDADLLITDLCPADVLLQRIGRLHRHPRDDRPSGCATPQCIALTPGDDLAPLLERRADANGLGPHGGVYRSLHILEATRRLIDEYPQWRIPDMNRELVERATHPDALNSITNELGDAWREHAICTAGDFIADVQMAHNILTRRDKSFYEDNSEVLFPSDDQNIRTRLGDDRVEITFIPTPTSPFDPECAIDELALNIRWLAGAKAPESVEPIATDDGGGFEFSVGQRRFRYDRLGLRRLG